MIEWDLNTQIHKKFPSANDPKIIDNCQLNKKIKKKKIIRIGIENDNGKRHFLSTFQINVKHSMDWWVGVLCHFWPQLNIEVYIYFIYNLHASTANHHTHTHTISLNGVWILILYVFFLIIETEKKLLLLFQFDAHCAYLREWALFFLSLDFQ